MEVSENAKMNYDECLENLLNTRNINVYLECLLALRDRYLIVAAIKDTLGSNIPQNALNMLHEIGFTKITSVLHKMYVGVCGKGKIIADITGEKPDDPVVFDGEFDGIAISASSKSWSHGNSGDIIINGANCSFNSRGLNFVIFDCEKAAVIDSIVYDSYTAKPTFYRSCLKLDDAFFESHFYFPEKYKATWRYPYSIKYFSNRKLTSRVIDNGIVLPNKTINGTLYGGVCDENFNYISGHETFFPDSAYMTRHTSGSYKVTEKEIDIIDETVMYGGNLIDHPGHLLIESFADRMWWLCQSTDSDLKIAITTIWGDYSIKFPLEILDMFGVPSDRIIICRKPTKFKSIIVPEQSQYMRNAFVPYDYTEEFTKVYRYIRKSIKPSPYKKIYFTKTKTRANNIIGEEWFIEYFRNKGFKVIDPEDYSFREKAEFLVGADEFVTQIGTNSHYALFCKPTVKLTILSRVNNNALPIQALLNEAAGITDFYCVDVSGNFLHKDITFGISLMYVTDDFKRYAKNVYNEEINITPSESLRQVLFEYLERFPEYYGKNTAGFNSIKNQKMLTVLQNMSEVFHGSDFDTTGLNPTTNEDNLQNQVKNLTADLDKSKKHIIELENSDICKSANSFEESRKKLEEQIVELKKAMEILQNYQFKFDELSKENVELAKSVLLSKQALKIQERDFGLREKRLCDELEIAKNINEKLLLQVETISTQNTNLEKQVSDYKQSLSWRMTKPLRSIAWFFRRLFGKAKQ